MNQAKSLAIKVKSTDLSRSQIFKQALASGKSGVVKVSEVAAKAAGRLFLRGVRISPQGRVANSVKSAGGATFGAVGAGAGVISMARDIRIEQQSIQFAPWEFGDEGGKFIVESRARAGILVWPFLSSGQKRYTEGPLKGSVEKISNEEVRQFNTDGRMKWGFIDWKGDFVPGTERKSLPVLAPFD